MEQEEGRRVAIWWTLIRHIRHILRCLQPDVTHGSHYSPQSNNLAQTKIIKKGKKKKNVLAFIQSTNATLWAMFSWLNTNTRLLWNDFFFPAFQIKQHVHVMYLFSAVFPNGGHFLLGKISPWALCAWHLLHYKTILSAINKNKIKNHSWRFSLCLKFLSCCDASGITWFFF